MCSILYFYGMAYLKIFLMELTGVSFCSDKTKLVFILVCFNRNICLKLPKLIFLLDNSASSFGLIHLSLKYLFRMIDDVNKQDNSTKFTLKISAVELETSLEEKYTDLLSDSRKSDFKTQNDSTFRFPTQSTIESVEKAVYYLDLLVNSRNCKCKFKYK